VDAGSLFMTERGASPPPYPTLPRKRGRVGRGAAVAKKFVVKRVLVVDVGGNSVKILASAHKVHRSFPSRPKMTPRDMLSGVKKLTADWAYDVVSIGYPGPMLHGRPVAEPYNLGRVPPASQCSGSAARSGIGDPGPPEILSK
jgi:hypothetical protein